MIIPLHVREQRLKVGSARLFGCRMIKPTPDERGGGSIGGDRVEMGTQGHRGIWNNNIIFSHVYNIPKENVKKDSVI